MIKNIFGKYLYLFLVIFVILPFFSCGFRTETALSIEGTVYQIVGVITVILGIDERLKHFRGKTILRSVFGWIAKPFKLLRRRFTKQIPKTQTLGGSYISSDEKVNSGGITIQTDHLPMSVQLATIRRDVDLLKLELAALEIRRQQDQSTTSRMVTAKEAGILVKLSESEEKLGAFLTESYSTELFGAIALIVGVLYGTLPRILSEFFGHLMN